MISTKQDDDRLRLCSLDRGGVGSAGNYDQDSGNVTGIENDESISTTPLKS